MSKTTKKSSMPTNESVKVAKKVLCVEICTIKVSELYKKRTKSTKTKKESNTTMDISQNKLARLQKVSKLDNQINHFARFIGDYITHFGYNDKTLYELNDYIEYFCAIVTRRKLIKMQFGKNDYTYSIYNNPIIADLNKVYNFAPISAKDLYFDTFYTRNRQDFCLNSVDLTKSEQCTQGEQHNSVTIAQDCVSECKVELLDILKKASKDISHIYNLLECFIITYTTEKSDKIRYKAVNAVNKIGDAVSQTYNDYEKNKAVSLDDFNSLYDISGSVKAPITSAVSDNYADIEMSEEMYTIVKKWIDNIDMNEVTRKIVEYRLINQCSIEYIAHKVSRSEQRVKDILTEFRKKLQEYINSESPNKIQSACTKKYIAVYDIFGKIVSKFDTVSECAKCLNVSRTAIQKALKNPRIATCKGYTMDTVYCDTNKKPAQHIVEKSKKSEKLTPEYPKIFVSDIHITTICTKKQSEYSKNDTKYLGYNAVNADILAKKHIF